MSTLCPSCGRPDTSGRDFCPRCGEYLRWDATGEHPRRVLDAPTVEMAAPARSPSAVLLNFDGDVARVPAGGLGSLRGTIRNQSGVVDNYEFRVAGVPADWVGPPPTAYLVPFGAGDGSEQDFELALTPPRAPEALAQPWPFTLEAVSRNSGAARPRRCGSRRAARCGGGVRSSTV